MTKLRPDKTLERETAVAEGTAPVVIELHAKHLVLRLKGGRRDPKKDLRFDYLFLLRQGRRLQQQGGR